MLIIKKIISFALMFLCLSGTKVNAERPISAQSYIVMCGDSVIYEKNAGLRLPMASTTKLMTALVAAEQCDMSDSVEIREEYCNIEGSSMYLKAGETLTVEELIKGLLLVSGNDAAAALACHISGSIPDFAELMNRKAAELSMRDSHFANPHGLSDKEHYSTAKDMAKLMNACLKNDAVRSIMGLKSCSVRGRGLVNHNKLLYMCRGCTGGKTGYTEAAGRCLVSSCMREGAELVCVTFNAPDDWDDHMTLYDRAYSEYSLINVTDGISRYVPYISSGEGTAELIPEKELCLFIKDNSTIQTTEELPRFVFAPAEKGERVGKMIVSVDGKYVGEYYLVYSRELPARH